MSIPIRFLEHVGTVIYLRKYWTDDALCSSGWPGHNAMVEIQRNRLLQDYQSGGEVKDYPPERWPTQCKACGRAVPSTKWWVDSQVFYRRLYSTPGGVEVSWESLVPGDFFYLAIHDPTEHCHAGWTNCDGRHPYAILPGGHHWDIAGRASNCDMKEETTHRCWILHGDPRTGPVTVDKAGHTCHAGAGSIIVPNWHGFLDHGYLTLQRGQFR